MNEISKPIAMAIKETKLKMINVINESGLSPVILDLIMQGVYTEIHSLAEKQEKEEEKAFAEMTRANNVVDETLEVGDTSDSK